MNLLGIGFVNKRALVTLPPGTKLGAYEIVAPIGSGGMGEVYRARDTKLGRDVAIKLLADSISSDSESRARFDREARTLASLNHPGIVTIFAVEKSGEHDFIAMELVEGRQLSELIVRGGIKLDRLLNIAAQIAAAVAAAHKHGIVHRDLKPANVIVGPHDRVKVLDFGIAKLRADAIGDGETLLPTKDITGQGRVLGTVSYMSPEQAEGRAIDDRSDVFSLGVVSYEMATGERPFKGDTSISVLSAILKDTPKPITEITPAVPKELARIVKRCLAKDPDDRYQSAADLRSDIEDLRQSAISGELYAIAPAPAGRSTGLSRGWIAAAVIAVTALGGIGWSLTRPGEANAIEPPPNMTFSRLTLLDGVSTDPMISPDGKWVAYVNNASGNQDIYLQSTTGQTAINLTKDSPAGDSQPAFSSDGELIAFRSERDGGGLFVMGRTGESVRRLTRSGYQPAWLPDGRSIVYVNVLVNSAEARGGDVGELWSVPSAGGEPRKIFAGDAVQPRVSPHGTRIAFWAMPSDSTHTRFTEANRDIWTIAVDGSDPVRVTSELSTEWNPVWSPDGRWLYYGSNRAGSMNLWRVGIDEQTGQPQTAPQAVTAPASYVRFFSLSSNGALGTYATQDVTTNIARVAFDPQSGTTKGEIQHLTTGPREFAQIDVSPDGTQLAFVSSTRLQEDVFLMNADGSRLRNLTNDSYRDRAARWMPDGKGVIFYSDRTRTYELWAIDQDGADLRQLTHTDGRRYFPVPSMDGTKFAAADITGWELFVHGSDLSTPADKLPDIPAEYRGGGNTLTPSAWSPDGTELAGSVTNRFAWVYSTTTRSYRRVPGPAGGPPRWLPDGRRLVVARAGRVVVADSHSSDARDVLSIPGENIGVVALSPDGKWLYFNHGGTSGDIWLVRFEAPAGSKTPKSQ